MNEDFKTNFSVSDVSYSNECYDYSYSDIYTTNKSADFIPSVPDTLEGSREFLLTEDWVRAVLLRKDVNKRLLRSEDAFEAGMIGAEAILKELGFFYEKRENSSK